MKLIFLLAAMCLLPSLALGASSDADVGIFFKFDCDSINNPVALGTQCVQLSTAGGRLLGVTYRRNVTNSGWELLQIDAGSLSSGTIPGGRLPKADVLDGPFFCADAGSTDAYACDLSPAITGYVTGAHYRFKANTVNTGAATINFNSLGAKTIKKAAGGITTDLATNDIRVGQWVELVYDGSNMQMLSLLGNAAGVTVPGSDTQVIINDGGALGADAGMTYNKTTDVLTVAGGVVSGSCATNCLTHDTSAITGSKTATWPNKSGTVALVDNINVSVYHDATQSISNNTETIVAFNQERFDTDTMHDNSTNNSRITFTQAGKYMIIANVCFDSGNTTGVRTFNIKAGSTGQNYIGNSGLLPAVVGEVCGQMTAVYNATAGDYATVVAFQTSGGSMNVKASGSSTTRNVAEFAAFRLP